MCRVGKGVGKTLPNIHAQVEAADTVLINQTDLHDEEVVAETEALVRGIKADATVVRTERCKVDLELFDAAALRDLEGAYAECIDPNCCKETMALSGPVNWPVLKGALEMLGELLYRAKGYVLNQEGTLLSVDCSSGWEESVSYKAPVETGLVLICHGTARSALAELLETIRRGEFSL